MLRFALKLTDMVSSNRILFITIILSAFAGYCVEYSLTNSSLLILIIPVKVGLCLICQKLGIQKAENIPSNIDQNEEYLAMHQRMMIKEKYLKLVIENQNLQLKIKNEELQSISNKFMRLADFFSHNLKSKSGTLLGLIHVQDKISNELDRKLAKEKIKEFAESLHQSLSYTITLLAQDTPIQKLKIHELIKSIAHEMTADVVIEDPANLDDVESNSFILKEILRTAMTILKPNGDDFGKVLIQLEASDNYWGFDISQKHFATFNEAG